MREVEIRRKLAPSRCSDTALDFMLKHEVAHLWHGHVELLHTMQKGEPFQEMRLVEGGLDISAVQTLEFDADGFAIQQAFAPRRAAQPFR